MLNQSLDGHLELIIFPIHHRTTAVYEDYQSFLCGVRGPVVEQMLADWAVDHDCIFLGSSSDESHETDKLRMFPIDAITDYSTRKDSHDSTAVYHGIQCIRITV